MPLQTPYQTETRSSRRRAAHGRADSERRVFDASTHEVITTEDKPEFPSRAARRLSRRRRSRSPDNRDRVYRTRETIALEAGSLMELNLAYRPRSPARETLGTTLSMADQRDDAAGTEVAQMHGGAWDQAILRAERAHATKEADTFIRKTVEAYDEQVAKDEVSTTADLEAMRLKFGHVAIHDRDFQDLGAHPDQNSRQSRDEQLIKHEESTFADAVWLAEYPFLKMADDEIEQDGATSPESPAHPVSDGFLQDLLPADETAYPEERPQSYTTRSHEDAATTPTGEIDPAAFASHHSNNYEAPFDWCSNPRCPIQTFHHAGPYLESGLVARQYNDMWGWSDPPAQVWAAWAKLNHGLASEYEENMVAGFIDAHYWQGEGLDNDMSEFVNEDGEMAE